MTHNRKPDVLPVEGASIAEALEALERLDAAANRVPANARDFAVIRAPLLTIRSALERAAAEWEAHRWIPCSERMPGAFVVVHFVALGEVCVGRHNPDRRGERPWDDLLIVDMCGDCDHYSEEQVTHWQPLPAPPKGSTP